jgi:hypothetical protein
MKTLVENYTFNAALKTVTFNQYPSIRLENVLLITNVATNQIIYNFSNALLGGTVLSNVLTLDFNTTSMSSTDALQVWYDDGLTPSSNEVLNALYEISTRLEFLSAVRGVSADLRVSPLSTPNMVTLSNIGAFGGWSANTTIKDWSNLTAINSNINNVQ